MISHFALKDGTVACGAVRYDGRLSTNSWENVNCRACLETIKVNRADLRHFDGEATRLILWAQEQGARVRISKRGHALLYGPNGATASVSSKSKGANRASKNNEAGVRRLFKEES